MTATLKTLQEIRKEHNLPQGDIDFLVDMTALPIHSFALGDRARPDNTWYGHIPSLPQCFYRIETNEQAGTLRRNIETFPLKTTLEGSIVRIEFQTEHNLTPIPASSIMYGRTWANMVEKHFDLTPEIYLLASSGKSMPLFCGHKSLLERLADNLQGDTYMVNALKVLEENNVLG